MSPEFPPLFLIRFRIQSRNSTFHLEKLSQALAVDERWSGDILRNARCKGLSKVKLPYPNIGEMNAVFFISERKGEGEIETSMMRIIYRLLPACPLLGIEPATRACALVRNQTVTSWFTGQCSTTEPQQPG
uniref:Uncharacterized protein n=1 Tax=Myotis myotis TaxID=51298 RepID=A0A7J7WHF6_MYOMY|nr:hypothetical protein mMyoMyo1_012038 [Myotis myotis]